MTIGTVIYTAVWQGLGNARLPFYATSIGMWCIRIGTGYLMGLCLVGACLVFGPEPFWIMVFVGYFYVTVTSVI